MKKTAVASAAVLTALTMLAGCQKEAVEQVIAPLVADDQDTAQTTEMEETEETPDIPEIDTSVQIEPGTRIAVVSKSTKGQFWSLVRKGMEAAVQSVNVAYGYEKDEQISMTFEGPDDEQDVETQINTLDAVIAENPGVLCISAGDMESCQAQLEAAKENGIPVIVFDSNVSETELVGAYRGTDNVKVGEMAAEKLGEAVGSSGKVLIFSAQEKTQSVKDRVEGFCSHMKENYPDIEIADIIYQDQVEDMAAAMQEALEKYTDLDGVFCNNADVSDLYLEMEKSEEQELIAMVGVDATTKQQEAVHEGEEAGVVSQNPYAMGYQTIWAAVMSTAEPEVEIEKNVLIEPAWIDINNLDDPAYSSYIYEK